MHVYDELLIAEARAASRPHEGILHDEVFIPEGLTDAIIQGGFSGAPVIWKHQVIGIVSHSHLSLVTQKIEDTANKWRSSFPKFSAELDTLSPIQTYHPLHNIYTRVDASHTREWIEAVRNNASISISVPPRYMPNTIEPFRD